MRTGQASTGGYFFLKKETLFTIVVLLMFGILPTTVVAAADYPAKSVELLCPYTPGSSMDMMARLIADVAPKYMGQTILVVNKPGAGGTLAAAEVISARPDGYKLITLANIYFGSTTKTQKVPFNPDDLVPLANFMEYRLGLAVRSDSPWKNLNDLLEYAKKNPGQLRWGHAGRGISLHTIVLLIFKKVGAETIDVPYKGPSENLSALLGGHLDASSVPYGTTREFVRAGKVRFLTFYGDRRYPDQPNVPSVMELGFPDAAKIATFVGLYAHRNTPENIRTYLQGVAKKIYDDPRFQKGMEQLGEDPKFGGPEFMRESIRQAEEVSVPILKELNLYVGK